MKFQIFGFMALTLFSQIVSSANFWLRTPESSLADFQKFVQDERQLTYVEWLQSEKIFVEPKSLDRALELSPTDPLDALQEFEKSISEIQSQLYTEQSRSLLIAIYEKMNQMRLPKRWIESSKLQMDYLRKFLPTTLGSGKNQNSSAFFEKELRQLQSKVRQSFGEDFLILINGLPLDQARSSIQPEISQQWALLSNLSEPLIFQGTWTDFQFQWPQLAAKKTRATGSCGQAQILSSSYEIQTQSRIFSRLDCDNLHQNSGLAHLMSAQSLHDSSVKSSGWSRWVGPISLVIVGALIYGLKDKEISFDFSF